MINERNTLILTDKWSDLIIAFAPIHSWSRFAPETLEGPFTRHWRHLLSQIVTFLMPFLLFLSFVCLSPSQECRSWKTIQQNSHAWFLFFFLSFFCSFFFVFFFFSLSCFVMIFFLSSFYSLTLSFVFVVWFVSLHTRALLWATSFYFVPPFLSWSFSQEFFSGIFPRIRMVPFELLTAREKKGT